MVSFLIEKSDEIKNILTSIAIITGGAWTFWRYVLQREAHAKVEFNVDLKVIGLHKDNFIVEVIGIIENKGQVRKYLKDFHFDLLYLSDKHRIVEGDDKVNKQIIFEKVISDRYWIKPEWGYTFIDAGTTQYYTYTTYLPLDAKFALVFAKFKYPGIESDFHTSQKTIAIQNPVSN